MSNLDPSTLPDDAKADLRALAKEGLKLVTEKRKPAIRVYRDNEGQFRWAFKAGNGKTLADSGQGYSRRIDCLRGLEMVTGGKVELVMEHRNPDGGIYAAGHLYRQRVGYGVEFVHVEVIP